MKTTLELQAELESIIEWFESDEADIDNAPDKYKRGLEIATEIETRLQQTKNKVSVIKKSFGIK